ncbi:GNAT family N-acetyltransferase [Aliamphritea spongicola]|uniref:GNAT family N-acetyltransferase n=1 Tax=Aliamphritea spongicola TaxID=707589 RepID=UPI00196A7D79|nr:GNAT family N-acetyltransferase [Aliamphritea spongicola]MBN3561027.1 GNAT family N-acetyltransferase [Aliamphritea spongicola]
MEFILLADRPQARLTIADWYSREWGYLLEVPPADYFAVQLNDYLNRDAVPLIVMAVDGDVLMGAAQLKYREMSIYPEKEFWLGGVYVDAPYRGRKIASALVARIEDKARQLGITRLHLQTEDLTGGLYTRSGWQATEQVDYRNTDVLVMTKEL